MNVLYRICRALLNVIYGLLFRLKAEGLQHIPKQGGVLLCSNHISLLDPPTVGIKLSRKIHFMAKAELFSFKPIGAFLKALGAFPVKRGAVSKDAIKQSLQLLRDGKMLCVFPEGTRNTDGQAAAKRGAAMFALRSGAAVVPCAIVGGYRLFGVTKVVYGPPIDLSRFMEEGAVDPLEGATEEIMKHIRALASLHQ